MNVEHKLESTRSRFSSFSVILKDRIVSLATDQSPVRANGRDLVLALSSFLSGRLSSEGLTAVQRRGATDYTQGALSVTRSILTG